MKKFIYALISACLMSCSNNEEKKETNKSTDTLAVENITIEAGFDPRLFKTLQLPLNIDTIFIMNVDTNDRIPYQQARQLGANFLKQESMQWVSNDINEFCLIDSLKQEDKYRDYIEKLEIGMTKKSIAYKVGLVNFTNGSKLFLWGIINSSYEACPFFSGTNIIGTFVNQHNQNTHFILAGRWGGGDPPAMMNKDITAKINADGKIEIENVTVNDDLDAPGVEITKENLILKAEKDSLRLVDFKKEVKSTEKTN